MAGEVVLVTGGGRGFGRAMAERFAAEGAAVAVMARSRAQLDEVVAGIETSGGRAMASPGDVADPADVDAAVSKIEARFGPVTRLVSNAGVPGPFGPLWVTDPDKWWRAQQVHLRAPYLLLRRVLPGMVERGGGRIVLVSAIASRLVLPGISAYSTGKAAQVKLAAVVAEEARDRGVSIFAIDPGFVVTQLGIDTYNDPDARKYMPHMMQYLEQGQAREGADADLYRCAQRCVDLFSGRYDALSGRYMELDDPIDEWLAEAQRGAAVREDRRGERDDA